MVTPAIPWAIFTGDDYSVKFTSREWIKDFLPILKYLNQGEVKWLLKSDVKFPSCKLCTTSETACRPNFPAGRMEVPAWKQPQGPHRDWVFGVLISCSSYSKIKAPAFH